MRKESRRPLAAILTAIVAAWLLPDVQPGLNFLIVALSIALTLMLSIERVERWDRIYFVLAGVLVAGAAVRAAPWIVALDLLAAAGLATIAVSEARTFVGIAAAPLRVLGSIGVGLRSLVAPLRSRLESLDSSSLGPVAAGTIVGVILVTVFGLLFTAADAAFAAFTRDLFLPKWRMDLVAARVITGVFTLVVCAALVATRASSADDPFGIPPSARASRRVAEWGIPLVMLDLLFGAFVFVQITVLFGGRTHVLETEGLTYAEYARQGFFQLLAVAALTLLVISIAVWVARPAPGRDRTWLRVLLGLLCLFTLVILASAATRLSLYEEAYGFTRLRVAVHATILWLAFVFGFVIWSGTRWRADWLPRVTIVSATVGLIALTAVDPDALIARANISRFGGTEQLDTGYLSVLSADAVPAIAELKEVRDRDCVLAWISARDELTRSLPWQGWNIGRSRARAVVREMRLGDPTEECPSLSPYGYD